MDINKEQLKKDINHIIDVSKDLDQIHSNINNHLNIIKKAKEYIKNTTEVKPVNIKGYSKTNLKIIK